MEQTTSFSVQIEPIIPLNNISSLFRRISRQIWPSSSIRLHVSYFMEEINVLESPDGTRTLLGVNHEWLGTFSAWFDVSLFHSAQCAHVIASRILTIHGFLEYRTCRRLAEEIAVMGRANGNLASTTGADMCFTIVIQSTCYVRDWWEFEAMSWFDSREDYGMAIPTSHGLLSGLEPVKASSDDVCVICLEEFVDGEIASSMPCKHLFHDNCITGWLQRSHTCPTCRFRITHSDKTSHE